MFCFMFYSIRAGKHISLHCMEDEGPTCLESMVAIVLTHLISDGVWK